VSHIDVSKPAKYSQFSIALKDAAIASRT